MRQLLSALLPHDRREQIVGDLHERGFRFLDIVNVVPRVWISHILRAVTGPIPQMAASDAAIGARTEKLARQGAIFFAGTYWAVWSLYLLARRGPQLGMWPVGAVFVALLLGAAASYSMSLRRALPGSSSLDPSHLKLLSSYRQQIDYQVTQTKGMLYAPSAIVVLWAFDWYQSRSIPTFLLVALPVALILAIFAEQRIAQLQSELELLNSPA